MNTNDQITQSQGLTKLSKTTLKNKSLEKLLSLQKNNHEHYRSIIDTIIQHKNIQFGISPEGHSLIKIGDVVFDLDALQGISKEYIINYGGSTYYNLGRLKEEYNDLLPTHEERANAKEMAGNITTLMSVIHAGEPGFLVKDDQGSISGYAQHFSFQASQGEDVYEQHVINRSADGYSGHSPLHSDSYIGCKLLYRGDQDDIEFTSLSIDQVVGYIVKGEYLQLIFAGENYQEDINQWLYNLYSGDANTHYMIHVGGNPDTQREFLTAIGAIVLQGYHPLDAAIGDVLENIELLGEMMGIDRITSKHYIDKTITSLWMEYIKHLGSYKEKDILNILVPTNTQVNVFATRKIDNHQGLTKQERNAVRLRYARIIMEIGKAITQQKPSNTITIDGYEINNTLSCDNVFVQAISAKLNEHYQGLQIPHESISGAIHGRKQYRNINTKFWEFIKKKHTKQQLKVYDKQVSSWIKLKDQIMMITNDPNIIRSIACDYLVEYDDTKILIRNINSLLLNSVSTIIYLLKYSDHNDIGEIVEGLKENGYNAEDIVKGLQKNGYDSSYTLKGLEENWYDMKDIMRYVKNAGYDLKDIVMGLKENGYKIEDIMRYVKNAGYYAKDVVMGLKENGYKIEDIMRYINNTGYDLKDVVMGLKENDYSVADVVERLKHNKYNFDKVIILLKGSGYKIEDIIRGLKNNGYQVTNIIEGLKNNGYKIENIIRLLKENGYKIENIIWSLKNNKYNFDEAIMLLKGGGYNIRDIIKGIQKRHHNKLLNVKLIIKGLKNSGYSAVDVVEGLRNNMYNIYFTRDRGGSFDYNNGSWQHEGSFEYGDIIMGLKEYGYNLEEIIKGLKEQDLIVSDIIKLLGYIKSDPDKYLLLLQNNGYDVEKIACGLRSNDYNIHFIVKFLIKNGYDVEDIFNWLKSNYGNTKEYIKEIAICLIKNGYDAIDLQKLLLKRGYNFTTAKLTLDINGGWFLPKITNKHTIKDIIRRLKDDFDGSMIVAHLKYYGFNAKDIMEGLKENEYSKIDIIRFLKKGGFSQEDILE